MNQEKFDKILIRHKKMISEMTKKKARDMIIPIDRTSQELTLVYANFKCEKCEQENNLQYHHLIRKKMKMFMDFWKYMSQRYYWANILILCKKCHQEAEDRINPNDISGTISEEIINKIKKKYK